MGHMATFALVVSFGTAAAPGAATCRGETTIWEVREGSKIQSPVRPAIRSTGLRKLLFSKKKLHKQAQHVFFYQKQKRNKILFTLVGNLTLFHGYFT